MPNLGGSETCVAYTLRSELDLLQQRRRGGADSMATEAMVLIVPWFEATKIAALKNGFNFTVFLFSVTQPRSFF